jgi:hypothetical protein
MVSSVFLCSLTYSRMVSSVFYCSLTYSRMVSSVFYCSLTYSRMVSSVFYCSLTYSRMVSSVLELICLWTVSSLFDFMSADGVVRFELNWWTVSFVFMTVFICFVSGKEDAILHFLHYTLQIFILVSFGLLGCWLSYIGNSSLEKKFWHGNLCTACWSHALIQYV